MAYEIVHTSKRLTDRGPDCIRLSVRRGHPSVHLLILDPYLLRNNRHAEHSGVCFLSYVRRLQTVYAEAGKILHIVYGEPTEVMDLALGLARFDEVVVHQDFTPYAVVRDRKLREVAQAHGVKWTSLIDHTLTDLADFQRFAQKNEPYKVYTPFFRKWTAYLQMFYRPSSPLSLKDLQTVSLMDFEGGADVLNSFRLPFELGTFTAPDDPNERLRDFLEDHLPFYAERRDHYAYDGTSSLSAAINTGAISIRHVYEKLLEHEQSAAWLRQLAWRDFYIYQSVYDGDFFKYEKKYDLSSLDDRHFESWRKGETGIPIIDAAMTELNETGHMPNRLRMVTAMFLTKNLLCPFTLGEQYFRYKLSDYDNTLNRGGWLWCASLGFDAAPYFRIMNPVTQSATHDPSGQYIRRWLPQLAALSNKEIHLPMKQAIVDVKASRAAAIEVYKGILRKDDSFTGEA
ncbi:cryptochrome/photolyase family protein [Paenibacillus hexagrammi]|uniref:cryptochrome/photolyase family protein n=1 Tax=Paenibacillus hexagrammi TaxID=2908839 RepID=UPI0028830B9D|nr:deoxyribodipyrimidine photo-lyase [Paenibacillus sp. YPD9-1]